MDLNADHLITIGNHFCQVFTQLLEIEASVGVQSVQGEAVVEIEVPLGLFGF